MIVTLFGKELDVPDWARSAAIDTYADKAVFVYDIIGRDDVSYTIGPTTHHALRPSDVKVKGTRCKYVGTLTQEEYHDYFG